MNTVTHALIPAIAAGIFARAYREPEKRSSPFSPRDILAIGLFGAAPDLINPHLYLAERYTSWSHSIFSWLGLTVILCLLHIKWSQWLTWHKIAWFSGAYGIHLICDAISGGLAWLYPWKTSVIGEYYVAPIWWIPLDIVCALSAYAIFRVTPSQITPYHQASR